MKFYRYICRYLIGANFFTLIILTINTSTIIADDDPLVDTADIERHVSHRFKLTPKEMKSIRPLIRMDNRTVVRLYWNATDEQRSNYMSLWDRLRQGRQDFEASLG